MSNEGASSVYAVEEWAVHEEPYYLPIADEVELFETAYSQRIPVLLKGPTGAGKTRFVEYMAYRLGRPVMKVVGSHWRAGRASHAARDGRLPRRPHRERPRRPLSAGCRWHALGRWAADPRRQSWRDLLPGRSVEARKDTTVLIHPLTDYRRLLPIEKLGQVVEAADGFLLVMSYNPGYQSALKDLKHSTRQRFIAIEFDYPPRDQEAAIIAHEAGCSREVAMDLARLGEKVRNLKEHGLAEGVSTRLLLRGRLIRNNVAPRRACQVAITGPHRDAESSAASRKCHEHLRIVPGVSSESEFRGRGAWRQFSGLRLIAWQKARALARDVISLRGRTRSAGLWACISVQRAAVSVMAILRKARKTAADGIHRYVEIAKASFAEVSSHLTSPLMWSTWNFEVESLQEQIVELQRILGGLKSSSLRKLGLGPRNSELNAPGHRLRLHCNIAGLERPWS